MIVEAAAWGGDDGVVVVTAKLPALLFVVAVLGKWLRGAALVGGWIWVQIRKRGNCGDGGDGDLWWVVNNFGVLLGACRAFGWLFRVCGGQG